MVAEECHVQMLFKKFKKLVGVLGLVFIFICHLTQQIIKSPISSSGDKVKLISSLEQFAPSFSVFIGIWLLIFADFSDAQ